MLVADAVVGVLHRIQRDLSILMRQRNELTSRMLFRGAALVAIDMRVLAAQHCMKGPVDCLQSQNIGASSVESEEDIDPRAEMLFELGDR